LNVGTGFGGALGYVQFGDSTYRTQLEVDHGATVNITVDPQAGGTFVKPFGAVVGDGLAAATLNIVKKNNNTWTANLTYNYFVSSTGLGSATFSQTGGPAPQAAWDSTKIYYQTIST
jgi:hypothetical protein